MRVSLMLMLLCLSLPAAAAEPADPAPAPTPAVAPTAPPPPAAAPAPTPAIILPEPSSAGEAAVSPPLLGWGNADGGVRVGGLAEVFYTFDFNQPANRIIADRAFDNRHNTITLGNAVVEVAGAYKGAFALVALQVGRTPASYYDAEPALNPPTWEQPAAAPGERRDPPPPPRWAELLRLVQQAIVGWVAPVGAGLKLEAGVFLSPVGIESLNVKDNFNWSRSNLFFALPYYHTGARISYPVAPGLTLSAGVWNGWNSIVDNNREKSLSAQLRWDNGRGISASVLYFGGMERSPRSAVALSRDGTRFGDPRPWRHLFDGWIQARVHPAVEMALHVNAGVEPTSVGNAWWAGAAGYARLRVHRLLYVALRQDYFVHNRLKPFNDPRESLFFLPAAADEYRDPARLAVYSTTATLDVRPIDDHLSLRLEARWDAATTGLFYVRERSRAPSFPGDLPPFVPDGRTRLTLTAGVTAWF